MGSSALTPGLRAADTVPRLNSWKEIAAYLGTSVRTVQRWERAEGLPVHRHQHASLNTVYAFIPALDAWLGSRGVSTRGRNVPSESIPPMTRVMVLPFRLIKPDSHIEFLLSA